MDLHPNEQIVFEGHPSWRGVLSFYVKGFLGDLAVAVVVYFVAGWMWAIVAFAVLFAITVLVGLVIRMSTVFTITNERLRIRRGILSKNIQQTSIDRVQNVNTAQRPIDRILRVGRVDFETAGEGDASFSFVGIAEPDSIVAAIDEAKRAQPDRSQGL